jgi:hypothetical protein
VQIEDQSTFCIYIVNTERKIVIRLLFTLMKAGIIMVLIIIYSNYDRRKKREVVQNIYDSYNWYKPNRNELKKV